MAKGTRTETLGRPNRIRFVMLDADLSDGNLSELTQAITNALRPSLPTRSIEPTTALPPMPPTVAQTVAEAEINDEGAGASGTGSVELEGAARSTPRKLPLPEYLDDLDMSGDGTSFKDFVVTHPAKTDARRYLVAAYWLKHHAKHEAVTADLIFTCYRTAGWPTKLRDWDVNFRAHVKTDKMRRIKAGEYKITPIGEDAVRTATEAE